MTWFWEDTWVGGLCLLDVFPRLYSFTSNRLLVVAHNGTWRRKPFVHEVSSVNTLLDMFQGLQIFSYRQDY
uniref:Reverse transcriptase zinc-binding domain-containing protein n=1 Tax=Cajanus cajan TaxID=3821 RepID=A0A151U3W7_CAJCA|nr:hypothetical protein KK1_006678 [Cajanus cajan]KYP74019.1 hypothetical protein KK1_006687 [Cajanus cajan]